MLVFLNVLKIAGLVLACIIGFVLLLLIIVLTVPVRYRFDVVKPEEGDIDLLVRVHWLARLFSGEGSFREGELCYHAKAAWFTLFSSEDDLLEQEDEKEKQQNKKKTEPMTAPSRPEEPLFPETGKEQMASVKEQGFYEEQDLCEKQDYFEEPDDFEEPDFSEKQSFIEKIEEGLSAFSERFRTAKDAIKERNSDKEKGKAAKIKELFFKYKDTKGFALIIESIGKLIRYILPQELTGHLILGMEDPSVTGKITAAAAALFPLYGNHFVYEPDFTRKRLDADCHAKGRIRAFYPAYLGIRLILNKEVRNIIKDVKEL